MAAGPHAQPISGEQHGNARSQHGWTRHPTRERARHRATLIRRDLHRAPEHAVRGAGAPLSVCWLWRHCFGDAAGAAAVRERRPDAAVFFAYLPKMNSPPI